MFGCTSATWVRRVILQRNLEAPSTTTEIQSWVTDLREQQYALNSIDHFHEVMNAVMRTAVTWYKLERNPARGVRGAEHLGKPISHN
jgi:hypothetical protein